MSKHTWSVKVKGYESSKIRNYNWLTKMYGFILRNPGMFRNRELTIFRDDKQVLDVGYDTIVARRQQGLKEGEERKEIMRIASELSEV